MNKVWVVTGRSESNDEYGPDVFSDKPTGEELSRWVHSRDGHFGNDENYEEGPGDYGSYIYLSVYERSVT